MSTTYSGSPTLTTSITIPSDGDSATANSVNVSSKALFDMQAYLLQTYGQAQQSTSPIKIRKSGSALRISPIPLVLMTEAGTWKSYFKSTDTDVGSTKVEGGGGLTNNTWYYLYAFSNAGSLDFQYSLTSPDSYNLFKNDGTFAFKYLTAVRTDNSGNLPAITKYGSFVAANTGISVLPGSGTTTTTETPIILSSVLAPYRTTPTLVKLQLIVTGNTVISNVIHLKSTSGSAGIPISLGTSLGYTLQFDIMTDDSQKLYWQADFNDINATVQFSITGYYE